MKAFYRVDAVLADPNGSYHGIKFRGGAAFLDWRILGEHQTEVAAQAFGHDPRFTVTEILESDLPNKPPKKVRNAK